MSLQAIRRDNYRPSQKHILQDQKKKTIFQITLDVEKKDKN